MLEEQYTRMRITAAATVWYVSASPSQPERWKAVKQVSRAFLGGDAKPISQIFEGPETSGGGGGGPVVGGGRQGPAPRPVEKTAGDHSWSAAGGPGSPVAHGRFAHGARRGL
eukprot:GGOE01024875.1.p4 GENE.GGOE01024875.1~~GGOE01024875.1.p4  ORF type:complete len:112 (+),score=0.10 GGOE01024875.1:437-772(+)